MGRRIGYLGGMAVLAIAGAYFFIYLYRWEWNRALFAGILFVATEVALGLAALLERMAAVGGRLERLERATADPRVLSRIKEAAPPARDPFAWLRPSSEQFSVFLPILMGAGVVASGLAWLVERLASRTANPVLENGLALQLRAIAWPDDGLVARRAAQLDAFTPRPRV